MRRRIAYGALGIVLLAVAVGLWAWRGDGSTAVHPDLNQPAVNAAAPADVPVLAQALAAPSVPPPAIATGSLTVAPPAASRPAASFDVVRVNPQGNAVMAGRAVPNANVVAYDGDTVIGRTTADKRGEWVILPETTLPPGPHTLRLDAPMPSDQRMAGTSEEISIVVPAPSAAIVAAMPAVALPTTASTQPRTVPEVRIVPEDRSTPSEAVQASPAQGTLAQKPLARDKAAAASRDQSLVVQPGHSLWRIARNSYGAGRHYPIIYDANRDRIGDPDLIYPGQIFTLPVGN